MKFREWLLYLFVDPFVNWYYRLTVCRDVGHQPWIEFPRWCRNCGKDM